MDLDVNFHLNKKTGEVTKMVNRGTDAMQVKAPLPTPIDLIALGNICPQITSLDLLSLSAEHPLDHPFLHRAAARGRPHLIDLPRASRWWGRESFMMHFSLFLHPTDSFSPSAFH